MENTSAHRIEIKTIVNDMRSLVKLKNIKALGFAEKIANCKVLEVYTIEKHLTQHELESIANALGNTVSQTYNIDTPETSTPFDFAIETGFLPGVTDNVGTTARETIEDLLKTKLDINHEGVYYSTLLLIKGVENDFGTTLTEEDAKTIADSLHNSLIEYAHIKSHEKYTSDKGMDVTVPRVHLKEGVEITPVDIFSMSEEELIELGKRGIKNSDGTFRGPLALDLDYIHTIRDYFKKEGRVPNDIELESIAQTWSEHCKHTIFAASLDDDLPDGLYKGLIKKATNEIRAQKGDKDFCVSVFKDNSGGITFDENWVVTDKAETHNSPSALDPFGGAITGIVGVNRDTIGFGKGAKPIVNKYGFCFANPDDKEPIYRDSKLTNPALLPRKIIDGVIAGVNAGGNCSGIPTTQGWQYFDDRYKGKPLIFVGTIGLIPKYINGKPSWEKEAKAGDAIVVLGGRVGQDGIHGATFSSEALNEGSPATAVQIGDPITQKKASDAIIKEIRSKEFYNSITDCGAGGISCSISEMARECGGCEIWLDRVPLKYPNLEPWKIWISESQERMTLSVPEENVEKLFDILRRRGVEATVVGKFNNSGRCKVTMHDKTIMDIDLEFLHEGLPKKHLTSSYTKPKLEEPNFTSEHIKTSLPKLLSSKNICGYEYISHQYDHMVQAITAVYPLQGKGQVNGTASAVTPVLGSKRGIIMSQGINPRYSDLDTYHMASCAIDTAIRNAVALGADIDYMALMDNFCWCSSNDKERLGQLKASVQACYDHAVAYGTPFISGKDSMFNDFKGYDKQGNSISISIPPTILISSLSVIEDVSKAVTIDPKNEGDLVYILGQTKNELGGSEYYASIDKNFVGGNVPKVDSAKAKKLYRIFRDAIQEELIASSFSISLGGLGVALAKKAIAGQLGLDIDLSAIPADGHLTPDTLLYSETQSRILVTVNPAKREKFEQFFSSFLQSNEGALIGKVIAGPSLILRKGDQEIANLSITELEENYRATFGNF